MNNIFVKDPENNINYLTPATPKRLLVTMGIKLVLAVSSLFALSAGTITGFARILLYLLFFAFVYDIGSLYQLCLHITQSVLIGFLLFLVVVFGVGIAFRYGSDLLMKLAPETALGGDIITIVMLIVFLIPFLIDTVRLVKLLTASASTPR